MTGARPGKPYGYSDFIKYNSIKRYTSKETRAYVETVQNRFEFVFTSKHGSWFNVIESFFSKMSHNFLRGLRVASKAELKERIELYLKEVNANPIPFRWKYGMQSAEK